MADQRKISYTSIKTRQGSKFHDDNLTHGTFNSFRNHHNSNNDVTSISAHSVILNDNLKERLTVSPYRTS